jgi:putrescine transport system permease protein
MNMKKFKRQLQRITPGGRHVVIGIPFLWLFLFFMLPFFIVLKISFAEADVAIPPYTEIYTFVEQKLQLVLNLANYAMLGDDELYIAAYLGSLKMAFFSTLLCLLIGYPMAYAIASARKEMQTVLVLLIILPSWTSFLIRVYAWIGILSNNGSAQQLPDVYRAASTSRCRSCTPDRGLHRHRLFVPAVHGAAAVRQPGETRPPSAGGRLRSGAEPWQAFFWKITVPLSRTGIIAGCMLVFIPAVGEFVIPELLGGPDTLMIGRVLWGEFFNNRDWPVASAVAIVMLAILIVPIILFNRSQAKEMEGKI